MREDDDFKFVIFQNLGESGKIKTLCASSVVGHEPKQKQCGL